MHVLQHPVNQTTSWVGRVRASGLISADGVRSIAMCALDSAAQLPLPLPTGVAWVRFTESNVDGPVVKLSGSANLRAASTPHRIKLFALDRDQSPYRAGQELVALGSSIERGITPAPEVATTDFVQPVRGVLRLRLGGSARGKRSGAGAVNTTAAQPRLSAAVGPGRTVLPQT